MGVLPCVLLSVLPCVLPCVLLCVMLSVLPCVMLSVLLCLLPKWCRGDEEAASADLTCMYGLKDAYNMKVDWTEVRVVPGAAGGGCLHG